jgi:hypothetical protein
MAQGGKIDLPPHRKPARNETAGNGAPERAARAMGNWLAPSVQRRGALLGVLDGRGGRSGHQLPCRPSPLSPRCIRLALLGLTCEAPPAPSSVAMDLKAQGLRRSPAAPTARPQAAASTPASRSSLANAASRVAAERVFRRWKKASLIRWGGRAPRPSTAPNGAPAVAQRGPGGGLHRHFRALGPFGARLFTPKLTPSDFTAASREVRFRISHLFCLSFYDCSITLVDNEAKVVGSALGEKIGAGRVAARPGEAGDKAKLDRVLSDGEHDRDRRGRSFGRDRSDRRSP